MTPIKGQEHPKVAQWHFPPNQNGAEYGFRDAAAAHFQADPIVHLVRESIQNSIDAKLQDLYEPVDVRFGITDVPSALIGSESLEPHISACLKLAEERNQREAVAAYSKALETLTQPKIRCLSIIDSGTTGLVDESWNALVIQEGIVHKTRPASGGSNGIGKNAVFNVSDLHTVIYSTRYLAKRKGREEKLQGKSRLISHPDPTGQFSPLQHIGFYRTEDGEPLRGAQIPEQFRLSDNGTGVFVAGFNPHSIDWARTATAAVVQNFFFAIHNRQLTVEIQPGNDQPPITLNHETLDQYFSTIGTRQNYAYYRAIRESTPVSVEADKPLGPLKIYILKGEGPRRTACLNRNGMLITDSRERKHNAIAPPNRPFWPDYAAVAIPETSNGDEWLRAMENPGHDAITPQQIKGTAERKAADALFTQTRKRLEESYEVAFGAAGYQETSNLTELAYALPEASEELPKEVPLRTSIIQSRAPFTQVEEQAELTSRDRLPVLTNQRIIANNNNEATIAFNVDKPGPITVELQPTGAERSSETRIHITNAKNIDEPETSVDVVDGIVHLSPAESKRIRLKITAAQDIRNLAFTF